MSTEKNEPTPTLPPEVKAVPCYCEHCSWTGTIGDTVITDKKARCPKCGGSLATNRPLSKIGTMVRDLGEAKWDGWD